MNLIDVLVSTSFEWPKSATHVTQNSLGGLCFSAGDAPKLTHTFGWTVQPGKSRWISHGKIKTKLAADHKSAIITKEQYSLGQQWAFDCAVWGEEAAKGWWVMCRESNFPLERMQHNAPSVWQEAPVWATHVFLNCFHVVFTSGCAERETVKSQMYFGGKTEPETRISEHRWYNHTPIATRKAPSPLPKPRPSSEPVSLNAREPQSRELANLR